MEELKSQKVRLAEELQKKQSEVSLLASHSVTRKKELESSQTEVQEKIGQIAELSAKLDDMNKTMLQV